MKREEIKMAEEKSIMDMLGDRKDEDREPTPEEDKDVVIEDNKEEEVTLADAGVEDVVYENPVQGETTIIKKTLEPEKKVSTEPWSQQDNPWAIDVLALKFKHDGFRPRFVPGNLIETRKDQGWVMAKCKDYNIIPPPGQGDTLVRRKSLFLMEMPEYLAKKREEYFERKTKLQSQDARQKEVTQAKRSGKKYGMDFDVKEF